MDGIKQIPILYTRKEECCGCAACYSICPRCAISMIQDSEGFEYPQINADKCIHCKLCVSVCPLKRQAQ